MADPTGERFTSDDFTPSIVLSGGQRRELTRIVDEALAANPDLSDAVGLADLGTGLIAIRFFDRNTGEPADKAMLLAHYGDAV
jgi:hypothetical protein